MTSTTRRVLVLTLAAAAAVSVGGGAEARSHRSGGSERLRARSLLTPAGSSALRVARLDVSRQTLQNQSIRLQVTNAPPGQTMLVFIADDAGVMAPVGWLRTQGRSGGAAWSVRTARGDALPFGIPDVAILAGRAIEVRSDAGEVLLSGVLPAAAKSTGISRKMKNLKLGLAVDPAANGIEARIVFRRGEHGRADRFSLRVEGELDGIALEAWLQGPDGSFVKLGDFVAEADEVDGDDSDEDDADEIDDDSDDTDGAPALPALRTKSEPADLDDDESEEGDDEGDDDADDDGGDDDEILELGPLSGGTHWEYEFDLYGSDALPFGAASLADLAGLTLEIRNADDQSVLASGILPDTSAPGHEADDDDEGDDEEEEDE